MLADAGQALLSIHSAGTAMGLFLVTLAGLIVSIAMLQSRAFSNLTPWFGIVANGFALIYFPVLVFAPALSAIAPSASAPFRLVWYVLSARRLFQLASAGDAEHAGP